MAEETEVKKVDGLSPRERSNANLRPATPFRKGVSGNPRGRPKKEHSLTTQLIEESKKKRTYTIAGVKYRGTNAEILAKRVFEKGVRQVNPKLVGEIFDRIDGKPVSALEVMGREGKPVEFVVKYDGNTRPEQTKKV